MTSTPYDSIATWYDAFVSDESHAGNFGIRYLFDLMGGVRGLSVCDLACGQGRIARELARRGAHVVGVDISAELLAMARRAEDTDRLGITYVHDDAQAIATIAAAQFDGAVCNLGLTDIPDLRATVQSVWRVLKPAGWFVFCIPHPCFEPPHADWLTTAEGQPLRVIRDYFGEGFWQSSNAEGLRGKVGAQHRTLSTLMNTLTAAGFAVERVLEPRADKVSIARVPGYAMVPTLLLVRSAKVAFDGDSGSNAITT